mmetsp:Transcript_19418/g.28996  ORF Transcript_19418/g.28996 Transcript_19418/m.28996 type:complete len:849 (+) Transcript_19418:487-3033(+)|eukprot:CAMPEP_0167748540 /NCGR_PEP_ID=MMETSP0110_2-20121227/4895_1 /TAXON_ID=629695 /ORGANISM="Gymnochlora sp., Strain CCMP2014" /LENGTH=848 /DNA_ID=CAMNT_0007633567 /DNA_START=406 /DNA_END=2952 /DNA_ORIENTATION=+
MKRARDRHALALGKRWLERTGGLTKKKNAATKNLTYSSYVLQNQWAKDSADSIQIEKDIQRTCISPEIHRGLYEFFRYGKLDYADASDGKAELRESSIHEEKIKYSSPRSSAAARGSSTTGVRYGSIVQTEFSEEEDAPRWNICEELRRVLHALVIRNKHVGYTQGMNYLACLLLGVMQEEDAFWCLCAIIEDLRLRDYYSPTPRVLGGYHLDSRILDSLVMESFPDLKLRRKSAPDYEGPVMDIASAVALCYPKWLLPMFYCELKLETMFVLWDAYFSLSSSITSSVKRSSRRNGAGESILFAFILLIVKRALETTKNPSKDDNVFRHIRKITSEMTPADVSKSIEEYLPKVSPTILSIRRRKIRSAIARDSNASPWYTSVLADLSSLELNLVREYQKGYWGWVWDDSDLKTKFRAHVTLQEEGKWFEVVSSQSLIIRKQPSLRKGKIFQNGLKNFIAKLETGSRIRKKGEVEGWIEHAKGWSPSVLDGALTFKQIAAPAIGLQKDAFFTLLESSGIPSDLHDNMLYMSDVDNNGFIDFPELLVSLSSLRDKADPIEHAKMIFQLFDSHHMGLLSRSQAKALCTTLHLPTYMTPVLNSILKLSSGYLCCEAFISLLLTPLPFQTNRNTHQDNKLPKRSNSSKNKSKLSSTDLARIAKLLQPLTVDMSVLRPVYVGDSKRGSGGLRIHITVCEATGLVARGGGLLSVFGGGSKFYCLCNIRSRRTSTFRWKSSTRILTNQKAKWEQKFTHEIIPSLQPSQPCPPLALLLSKSLITFSVYEQTSNGKMCAGKANCRLDQLKIGHELAAGYALVEEEKKKEVQGGRLFVRVLLESTPLDVISSDEKQMRK